MPHAPCWPCPPYPSQGIHELGGGGLSTLIHAPRTPRRGACLRHCMPSATTAWACAMPALGTSTMPLKPRRQHALPGPSRCSIWRFSAGAKRPFFFLQFPDDNRSLSRPAWDKRKESSHNCVFTSVRSRRGFSTMTIGELRRRRQAMHRAPCRMRGRPWACALRQVRKLYKQKPPCCAILY